MHRLKPDSCQSIVRKSASRCERGHGCLMSLIDSATDLVTVGLRSRIDFRKIDQLKARPHDIQTTQRHQDADGGLAFTKCQQLSAKIGKGALRLSQVSRGLVVRADLPGTDCQLPRPRRSQVSERKHPLDRVLPKTQNRLYRSADQLNGHPGQKEDGRNRHQVDIPLHVMPQLKQAVVFRFSRLPLMSAAQQAIPRFPIAACRINQP